jgi:hypothetical protein
MSQNPVDLTQRYLFPEYTVKKKNSSAASNCDGNSKLTGNLTLSTGFFI